MRASRLVHKSSGGKVGGETSILKRRGCSSSRSGVQISDFGFAYRVFRANFRIAHEEIYKKNYLIV